MNDFKKINYKNFEERFLESDLGKKVLQDFTYITCTNNHWPSILEVAKRYNSTCRELLGNNNLNFHKPYTTLSIVTFFYLEFLQEKNPKQIYDIGCGWNIWKKYLPNIVGVDDHSPYADIIDEYNSDFLEKNYKKFEAVFSINMNFGLRKNIKNNIHEATNFENFTSHLMEFSNLLQPGGRGYLSVPALGLYKFTSDDWCKHTGVNLYNPTEMTVYLEKQILSQNLKILALDLELDLLKNHPGHDGEIRVVFETYE